ncbi:MAG: prepilin-type N-terminal cleavage/methylation domain-containing protein [Actinomycetota bacterium]
MTRLTRSDEEGFSMVELMVVLLIIAILIAIAIPTFAAYKSRAQDTAAKTSAVLAVRTAAAMGQDAMFDGVTTASLKAAQPSLDFVDGTSPSTYFKEISQIVPDAGAGDSIFVVSVLSATGTCFMMRYQASGSDFAQGTIPSCEAGQFGTLLFGPSW